MFRVFIMRDAKHSSDSDSHTSDDTFTINWMPHLHTGLYAKKNQNITCIILTGHLLQIERKIKKETISVGDTIQHT